MVIETAEIERVSAQVGALAACDVSELSKGQLLAVTDAVAKLERVVGALGARCAGEIARRSSPDLPGGGLARSEGHGTPGEFLANERGGTVAGAKKSIGAGEAFVPKPVTQDNKAKAADAPAESAPQPRFPVVAQALTAGELSVDGADLIVKGLKKLEAALPVADVLVIEGRLVSRATTMNARDVGKMVARAVAKADRAGHEQREREIYEDRYLWWKTDHEGIMTIHGQLDAVTAAPIISVLEQMTTRDVRRKGP